MASIELINLTKKFGDLIAVNDLNLVIPDKEFVALCAINFEFNY